MQEISNDLNEKLIPKDFQEDDNDDIDMSKIFNNEYNTSEHASEKFFKTHLQSVERVGQLFKTDFQNGLSSSNKRDMEWREKKWGNNHLPPERENSILEHILNCFEDPMLCILLGASIVSLVIGILKDGLKTGWIEGTAIFIAVFLVVSISSYMNYQENEQFLKLTREARLKKVLVIRDGMEKEISIEDVLVGDILKLRIGDIINVDGFVFGDAKAGMDESPVTGESDIMWKINGFEIKGQKYSCPFVFSGSQVIDGHGSMVVAAVGGKTFEGQNKQLLSSSGKKGEDGDDDANLTPLKKQLNVLSNYIGDLGIVFASLIGVTLLLKETIINLYNGISIFTSHELDVLVNAFIIAVTVIVVAIPEGLPMAVTIAFAFSVGKMKEEHNLVKCLDKSEAMGNVNNVCTDKTGTLTLGVMRIAAFFIEDEDIRLNKAKIQDENLRSLIWNCIYKNITCVETTNEKGEKILNGDMTEKALFTYLKENGYSLEGNRKGKYVLPFKSDYKYMMNIFQEENGYILYAKGAPERVSTFFSYYRTKGGQEDNFEEHAEELTNQQAVYAEDSMRTLIFGYKKLTEEEITKAREANPEDDLKFFNELAKGLCFAFMVGIRDNNREDVPEAINKCRHAGITVRMVTGDNINTAIAISKDVGIIEPHQTAECKNIAAHYRKMVEEREEDCKKGVTNGDNPIALEGEIFRIICGGITKELGKDGNLEIKLNNKEAFRHTVHRLKVIARASPEDKFILVFGLKELGNIVAVTGDGTNDAPALKQAHVGFAMGIRGTDIAKDAADVVLLDDSFSSIVTACKYGRNIYDCIRKFVQFQLTTNVVAVFMTFLGGIILKDSPLNAIQMLWVNLIMDSFASLALATEDPTDALLDRKPYPREASILTPMMILNIISQSLFQIITLTVIIFYGDYLFGVPSDRELEHFVWNNVNGYHFTIFFNIFVYMQVFNSINARKLQKDEYNVFSGILGNWLYLMIQGIIIVGQVILVTFGGRAVRTHPLTITQHCQCLLISSMTLVWGFLAKLLPIDVTEKVEEDEERRKTPDTYKKTVGLGYMSRGKMHMSSGIRSLSSNSRVKK